MRTLFSFIDHLNSDDDSDGLMANDRYFKHTYTTDTQNFCASPIDRNFVSQAILPPNDSHEWVIRGFLPIDSEGAHYY